MKRTQDHAAQPATETRTDGAHNRRTGPAQHNPKRPGVQTLAPDQRAAVLALLESNPDLSDSEIAETTGVSRKSVWRLRQEQNAADADDNPDADAALERLERLIGKRLPPERLVRSLERLITDAKTPATVRLSAVRVVVELRGMVTRKERKDAAEQRRGNVYIFAPLAPGAAPLVQAHPVRPDDTQDTPAKDKIH